MEMLICCLLFAVGVALVVKGGDVFVDSASRIAHALGIPSFIIGATIVSLATTMPEMLVSVMAAAEGKADMAVGNAVGSVTANTGLIMAAAMIFMEIAFNRKKYLRQCLLLIAAASVLLLGCRRGALSMGWSAVLALIFLLFMAENIRGARSEMLSEERPPLSGKAAVRDVLLFLAGAAAIIVGSRLMVNNGSAIALRLGVPERVIALTLVAVGTSLPELVTTITAIVKKESGLSVGNIIGANIIDLSLILPVSALASGRALPISAGGVWVDLPVCLGVTLLAIVPLLIRQRASKLQGAVLLIAYAAYLMVVI